MDYTHPMHLFFSPISSLLLLITHRSGLPTPYIINSIRSIYFCLHDKSDLTEIWFERNQISVRSDLDEGRNKLIWWNYKGMGWVIHLCEWLKAAVNWFKWNNYACGGYSPLIWNQISLRSDLSEIRSQWDLISNKWTIPTPCILFSPQSVHCCF